MCADTDQFFKRYIGKKIVQCKKSKKMVRVPHQDEGLLLLLTDHISKKDNPSLPACAP